MNDRDVRILDLLAAHKRIKVSILAEILNVSQSTLRNDLENLEKRGIIRRTHGYANLDNSSDTGRRIALSHSIKRKIAKAAALTVEDGETIMLESGSCCAIFAEELAKIRKNVTIITNSVFIANYVYRMPNIRIILLGGYFLPESQVLVGTITQKCAEEFFLDKFFLGTDGFIPGFGFTGRDHHRVKTAAEMVKYANKAFILTEAAKFNRRGTYSLIQLDRLTGVFTDDNIPKEAEIALIENKVLLYKVNSADDKIVWCHFPN